jgi:hypothetical protein
VLPQDALRMQQQPLAGMREHHAASGALEQRLVDALLEPPHLLAERGLRAADPRRRAAERAHFGDHDERAQQIDVERTCQGISSFSTLHKNYSFPSKQSRA